MTKDEISESFIKVASRFYDVEATEAPMGWEKHLCFQVIDGKEVGDEVSDIRKAMKADGIPVVGIGFGPMYGKEYVMIQLDPSFFVEDTPEPTLR